MDQQGWNRIYDDLDDDLVGAVTRSGGPDIELFLDLDRARFAIDKGDHARAIELLEQIQQRLNALGTTRGGPAPSAAAIEALEDQVLQDLRLGSARLEVVGEAELPDEQVTRSGAGAAQVNRSTKFDDIADEYVTMFESAKISADKTGKVRWYTDKLIEGRAAYEEIMADTKVPWYMVGLIHGMECGFSMQKHLHNGDSLKARTWQVPKGRPKDGSPPFQFVASAVDALSYDKLNDRNDWDLAHILYRLELYNGWGYRKSRGMATPYLWSFSNHHQRGKYVQDGKFDPNATSAQCGAAVMLRDLVDRKLVSFKPEPPAVPAAGGAAAAGPVVAEPAIQQPVPSDVTPPAAPAATTATQAEPKPPAPADIGPPPAEQAPQGAPTLAPDPAPAPAPAAAEAATPPPAAAAPGVPEVTRALAAIAAAAAAAKRKE